MAYTEVQPIVLSILTSIITGGFVLVFVEIGNRKNRYGISPIGYSEALRVYRCQVLNYYENRRTVIE